MNGGQSDELFNELLAAVNYRENLIERGRQLVSSVALTSVGIPSSTNKKASNFIAHELVHLSNELRESALRCVSCIIAWTVCSAGKADRMPSSSASASTNSFDGDAYLCKMLQDIDFLYKHFKKGPWASDFRICDPLLIRSGKTKLSVTTKRAAMAASLVILDAIIRRDRTHVGAEGPAIVQPNLPESRRSRRDSSSFTVSKERDIGDSDYVDSRLEEEIPTMYADELKAVRSKLLNGKKMKYLVHEVIGRGAYAAVHSVQRQDGKIFAAKVFDTVDESEDDETVKFTRTSMYREIEFFKKLKRPSLVNFEECIFVGEIPYIIMEKMECNLLSYPDVDRHSRGRPSPIEKSGLSVLIQVLDALAYLHSQNIIHRDVKPENILVSRGYKDAMVIKLADLGSARDVKRVMQYENKELRTSWATQGSGLTEYVGSRWYRAPELLGSGTDYSINCDVWSLGCTLCEFISSNPLFPGDTEQNVLDKVVSYYTLIPEGVNQSLSKRGFRINRLGPKDRRSFQSELPNIGTIFRSLLERMLNLDFQDRENAIEFLEEATALHEEGMAEG